MEDTLREYNCYNYLDTPDGEDIGKKIWSLTKYAISAGTLLGVSEILLNSQPKTVMKTIARFSYVFLPIVSMPVIFVAVTNHLAILRCKDDKVNWAMGGLVTAMVPLVWRRTVSNFVFVACMSTAGATLAKFFIENKIPFTFKKTELVGGIWIRHDFTLTRCIPGNYIIKKK